MGSNFTNTLFVKHAISLADWRWIEETCCRTGDAGEPIAREREAFFLKLWVEPYFRYSPDGAFIVERDGTRLGYLTGVWDTGAFEKLKKRSFARKIIGSWILKTIQRRKSSSDELRWIRRSLKLEKGPEECFSTEIKNQIRRDFPAHLHMNCVTEARGQGLGRALFTAFIQELVRRKIPGVHVYCGDHPRAFYERMGMRELERIEYRPGVQVYAYGLKLEG
ncbi:MAG: GNAT family N-acetyltransferase [Proteobacteria bacterium]|nr:MAG: GNAT family N-acetyltransferase [Pseudomonadota bacterium]